MKPAGKGRYQACLEGVGMHYIDPSFAHSSRYVEDARE
jgi:hypothetical protein